MIERTFDYRRVNKVTPWWAVPSKKVIYLIETDGQRDYGVWSLHESKIHGLLIHADMTKACRGRKAVDSMNNALSWVFKNTGFEKIRAKVSINNKPACFMASWSDMEFIRTDGVDRFYEVTRWVS